ncbi:threonine-phosphate decarboxylase CobD [Paenibacillus sp. N1-5-1-14]|uniref:threonine-phosphate decarboxylase CobD n=1 Tax=Paenibacillus radicibacter TaxID=2972488 RepID=UPI00215997D3|nr:threonine-phosphate decarboxylase CobD [Paenibacillus radicibacter]MCR8644892.1 threonine-phosphate decarboxylase CobD [Paenibacillus radicibacter]
MLERYGHGGDLRTAAEAFGLGKDQFLDFSANMNPLGPPACVEDVVRTKWADVIRYPDPICRDLVQTIARHYDIPEASILVGNGAAELIDLLIRVTKPKTIGLARPSFSEYEEAAEKIGCDIIDIPLRERDGFVLQQADVEAVIEQTDTIFLGHPNNPTGRLIPSEVIDAITSSGHPLILDEAFVDFLPNEMDVSRIRQAAVNRNVCVIRSMTKFYSIPGIRLGFLVAHPDQIHTIKQYKVPWSVNFLAQEIGTAVLQDQAFTMRTHQWLLEEGQWLTTALTELGLQVTPSDTNFIMFAFPASGDVDIKIAQSKLGQRGILVRDASLFAGLDKRYCRVAIRLREDNERLIAALSQVLKEGYHS